jgi:anti-sigma regulatory factor (Ser/Thr protein kinase)
MVAAEAAALLEMAVMEAVGNVVRHAAQKTCEFSVEIARDGDDAVVVVVDHGPGFELRSTDMPDAYQEYGRGLPLMQRLCDSVEYRAAAGGNRLVLKKRVSADGRA